MSAGAWQSAGPGSLAARNPAIGPERNRPYALGHGIPSVANAHPHSSGSIWVVHNGIIENHAELRIELQALGYTFTSQTDSEVIAHLIAAHQQIGQDMLATVRAACMRLRGAYAIAAMSDAEPGVIIGTRHGSPLVLGLGDGENYLASDTQALLSLTRRFIYLEDGDCVHLTASAARIHGADGAPRLGAERQAEADNDIAELGDYAHFMQKEIHEQPQALTRTLRGRLQNGHILHQLFEPDSEALLKATRSVHIVACGTSLYAGMVARHWIESIAGIPCHTDVASEYRYGNTPTVAPGCLYLTITQSGETSDTLAALRHSRGQPYLTRLAICNVAESSVAREADVVLMTRAGPEIGVASTKAFTTQLAALALLALELARARDGHSLRIAAAIRELEQLPALVERTLAMDAPIRALCLRFLGANGALFLGRGACHALALEGALKLKEITYLHAEGFAAGELKHGPLALVDERIPVIALAPSNDLIFKLLSNVEEVRARGGRTIVFADEREAERFSEFRVIALPTSDEIGAPVVFAVALQLLAYHVAVLLGTDIDQPRNLAKSVTVE